MLLSMQSNALRYHEFGQPLDQLRLERYELPRLQTRQALVRVLAAPINPADFGRILGVYGSLAQLPAVGGLEGVGEIIELGPDCSPWKTGQRVQIPTETGSWQTHAVIDIDKLYAAPDSLPLLQAAMSWVNPATAWLLLSEFADLQPGDWIIQNAATSGVGQLVIQFAKHRGLNSINLVRNLDAEARLKPLGADIVLLDEPESRKRLKSLLPDAKPKLALNSVGATSADTLAKCLAPSSNVVTFGGMDREPGPLPTGALIFNDIRYRGFWVSRWYRQSPRDQIEKVRQQIFDAMKQANIEVAVAQTYPLADYQKALEHSQQPGKPGKILFQMSEDSA